MTKKQQFLKDVMHEINALKQNATQKEINRLNFDRFYHANPHQCIYGLMCKGCYTLRAKKLMDASCIRVMDLKYGVSQIEGESISSKEFKINGKNTGQGWDSMGDRNYSHLSALEGYICTKNANNKGIIQYLKGEIQTLEL